LSFIFTEWANGGFPVVIMHVPKSGNDYEGICHGLIANAIVVQIFFRLVSSLFPLCFRVINLG
jgi:hypothetical protein